MIPTLFEQNNITETTCMLQADIGDENERISVRVLGINIMDINIKHTDRDTFVFVTYGRLEHAQVRYAYLCAACDAPCYRESYCSRKHSASLTRPKLSARTSREQN